MYTPEAEFYFSVAMHHLLLFVSAVLWFKIGGLLGLGTVHFFVGIFYVVLMEAAFLPQSFWSENISMPLVMYVLYAAVKIYKERDATERWPFVRPLLLGLALGFLITTRVTPVIFLLGIYVLFIYSPISRSKKIKTSLLITGTSLGVVFIMMAGNMFRYGHFEFTSNLGGHLWNIVHEDPELVLKETPQFQKLRSSLDLERLKVCYWVLDKRIKRSGNPDLEVYANNGREYQKFLRSMVLDGIGNHPFIFLKWIAWKTVRSFGALEVERVGKWGDQSPAGLKNPMRNPLKRTSYLPAPIEADNEKQAWFFDVLYERSKFVSRFLFDPSGSLFFALLMTVFYGCLQIPFLIEEQKRSRLVRFTAEECVEYVPVFLFLAVLFLGYHVLTNFVEHYHNRFYLTALPVLALLVSIEIKMIVSIISRLIGDREKK